MTASLTRSATSFVAVDSLAAALATLAEHGPDARVLAGGTDLMLQIRRGEMAPGVLVYVGRVDELGGIETTPTGLRIGATATHRAVNGSAETWAAAPALATAAGLVGGRQTQSVGTIAGNIVNASPAADLVPPLAAAGATVILVSVRGERVIPLLEFVQGRRATSLASDELMTAIHVPTAPSRTGDAFVKIGRRAKMEISIASLAVRLTLDESGAITEAKIVVGACGPVPFHAAEAAALLVGATVGDLPLDDVGDAVASSASPIDDHRSSARYRSQLLAGMASRGVEQAIESIAPANGVES